MKANQLAAHVMCVESYNRGLFGQINSFALF